MSAIIVAGNEIIPDTLTVTVDGTEITAKDFQKVLLNINQASATASVADGTDLMQKMEIINKNANACDVSFTGKGGATVKNLKQNQSMRLSWTGSYWYVTFGGLLSGVANDGTPFNYTTEVTLDEAPVNTVYSTTEQDTGMTWIDGKKIYRLTIKGTPSKSVGTNRDMWTLKTSVSDIAAIIKGYGYYIAYRNTTMRISVIPGASFSDDSGRTPTEESIIAWYPATNEVGMSLETFNGFFTSVTEAAFTVEYTKTTD